VERRGFEEGMLPPHTSRLVMASELVSQFNWDVPLTLVSWGVEMNMLGFLGDIL
jgi:hypothetical protein